MAFGVPFYHLFLFLFTETNQTVTTLINPIGNFARIYHYQCIRMASQIYFPTDVKENFPNLDVPLAKVDSGKRSRSFVNVLQTSDILGNPNAKLGNLNVILNGGRLQPGCFTNENNITQCDYFNIFLFLNSRN